MTLTKPKRTANNAAIVVSHRLAIVVTVAQAHAYADRTSVRQSKPNANSDSLGSADPPALTSFHSHPHARSVAIPHANPPAPAVGDADDEHT